LLAFVSVIFVLIALVHYYLWKRLVGDTLPAGRARRAGTVVAVLFAVLVPATLIGVRSGAVEWLAWPGYLWLALMFYLLITLAVLELPRFGVRLWWRSHPHESDPGRRLLLARGTAIVAGLTAASITGYGMKTALGPPQLDRVQLPLRKLPRAMDGTRLAVVSDIHLGPLTGTRHAGRIVDLINSVQADIVCVVGDLVDGTVAELGRFATPLADIESRYGAYFVTGNHEYYSGYAPWVEEVAQLGVKPLRNERVEINGLDLAGVNDLGGAQYGDAPDFAKALGDRDATRPVVLMAHQPVAARQAAPFGVDLQVSGHTHGGQMAPFNLLVKLQQPVVSGYGDVDGVPVFVTNGAGTWGPPVRVGAPPQVTVIELRSV
jgi:predicted MPP superfamily phosphohydrolase